MRSPACPAVRRQERTFYARRAASRDRLIAAVPIQGFRATISARITFKSGVVIKGCIALPSETIKDHQQTSMFLVDARPHEIDDGDVVARLTSRTEPMAEHEPEGSPEHCFVGLLKASLLVKSENFVGRGELLVRAREKAFNLRPVNGVRS